MKKVVIYTDGACSGNPGPGGWAAILIYGKHEREMTGGESETTNNRMELTAAIEGLRALKEPCHVALHSDSRYLINAFQKRWIESWKQRGWKNSKREPVPNRDLWEALLDEVDRHRVEWLWVQGHADDLWNGRCDALAVAASQALRKKKQLSGSGSVSARPGRVSSGSPWQEFERKRWSEEAISSPSSGRRCIAEAAHAAPEVSAPCRIRQAIARSARRLNSRARRALPPRLPTSRRRRYDRKLPGANGFFGLVRCGR